MKDDLDLFGNPPPRTQCAECGKVFPQEEKVVSTVRVSDKLKLEEDFCSEGCAETHTYMLPS